MVDSPVVFHQRSIAKAEPLEIKTWLEWAGSKLLAMHIASPAPKGYKVAWPEYATDHKTAYGYTGNRLKAAEPRSVEIELMDKLLLFPNLISDVTIRRIVNARSLVTPVSNRYVYSWTKLGYMIHVDPRRVVRLHQKGLVEISSHLTQEKVDAIRRLRSLMSI